MTIWAIQTNSYTLIYLLLSAYCRGAIQPFPVRTGILYCDLFGDYKCFPTIVITI